MDRNPNTVSLRLRALFTAAMLAAGFVQADPFAEIASFSSLTKLDPARIEKGEVVSARIPGITLPKGQGVESVFVVEAPFEKTFGSLKSWNGARHPDLKVYLHGENSVPPTPADFQKLQSAPSNAAVHALADASHLQLAAGEAEKLPKNGGGLSPEQVAFWSGALEKRTRAFLAGGAPALPPYFVSGRNVSAGDELAVLLRSVPKIQGQFRSILGASGISGRPAGKTDLYWELVSAEGEAVINLGASTFAMEGKTAQSTDVLYFATGNYYALVTLYQIWPIQVGSKEATLVWRADLVSSASLEALHGIERNAAGSALSKEVARLIGYFQRDTASR